MTLPLYTICAPSSDHAGQILHPIVLLSIQTVSQVDLLSGFNVESFGDFNELCRLQPSLELFPFLRLFLLLFATIRFDISLRMSDCFWIFISRSLRPLVIANLITVFCFTASIVSQYSSTLRFFIARIFADGKHRSISRFLLRGRKYFHDLFSIYVARSGRLVFFSQFCCEAVPEVFDFLLLTLKNCHR